MILTEVWVPGHPKTKGSLTAKGGYATDTPASKRWRAMMAEQVRRDIEQRNARDLRRAADRPLLYPYGRPVMVAAYFWLEPGTAKAIEHGQQEGAATWPMAGDVDKLARNLLDALAADAKSAAMNGGAIMNDNQVINCNVWKFVAERAAGRPPGVWLSVVTAELGFLATVEDSCLRTAQAAQSQYLTT